MVVNKHRRGLRRLILVVVVAYIVAINASCSLNQQATDQTISIAGDQTGVQDSLMPGTTEPSTSPLRSEVPSTEALTTVAAHRDATNESSKTLTGAAVLLRDDFQALKGKRVGLIANQASIVDGTHLVDLFFESENVDLVAVFAPEHGWRGSAGAGVEVPTEVDPKTGLPVYSLYGPDREPSAEMLDQIDLLVFDLQDVGARYYTYISTMGLAMKAAAENGVEFMVLDRPNPRGGELSAGPVRDGDQESFVGRYPIPTLYGLTAGELANAIVGEGWLPDLEVLALSIVEMEDWDRQMTWSDTGLTWTAPSPGLPTVESALIYPATVQFEATTLSYGRGTDRPFSQVGAPWLDGNALARTLNNKNLGGVEFEATRFTPEVTPDATDPQYEGIEIPGVRINLIDVAEFEPVSVGVHLLEAVLDQAEAADLTPIDRAAMFDLLAGNSNVRLDLLRGLGAEKISSAWQSDIEDFDRVRQQYQIYD